jgi:hypothetical protein
VVPGFDGSLRPDFVAVNETCKTVAIIDVTMRFENRYAAFQAARQEKQEKYTPLADPANERIIHHLKLGHGYCCLMRKLMVSAIRWSHDIYIEHLSEVKQYQDTGDTRSG